MDYVPGETGSSFMESEAFIKIIMGPVGGGKSTVCLFDILQRAQNQTVFGNTRRTKYIFLRNTVAQLKSTVKPLITQWLVEMPLKVYGAPMGQWRLTENVFEIKCQLEDGTIMHTEFYLLAADTPDDVRRLLSLEASGAFVEEAREIDEEVFKGLLGRVARYPNVASGGVKYPGVVCATNPPPMDTYWQKMIASPPKNAAVFVQPEALLEDGSINPEAENLEHLDPEYYPNLVAANTEDWIDVYLKNKFGPGGFGQPVFKSTFKLGFHKASAPLRPISGITSPLVVGMDNGLQAAACVVQQDARGLVNVLSEAYVPADVTMGVESFLDRILIPHLNSTYPTARRENFIFNLDPACFQRSQVNEATIAQAVQSRGFVARRASTNDPGKRIDAVEGLLTRAVDGTAGLRFDPDRCPYLLKAMDWGYRYKKAGAGHSLQIDKNHFSHLAESLQYACLHFNAQFSQTMTAFQTRARTVKPRAYNYV